MTISSVNATNVMRPDHTKHRHGDHTKIANTKSDIANTASASTLIPSSGMATPLAPISAANSSGSAISVDLPSLAKTALSLGAVGASAAFPGSGFLANGLANLGGGLIDSAFSEELAAQGNQQDAPGSASATQTNVIAQSNVQALLNDLNHSQMTNASENANEKNIMRLLNDSSSS